MSSQGFDVIVIGAGPAGEVVAGRLAEQGAAVAIVESDLVGGECSFYACMPSKALLRPAQALDEARRVPGAAQAVSGGLDVAAVLSRRDEIIHDLDDSGQVPWLQSRGVTLIRGRGRLDGERRVRVNETVYEATRAVVIAVGSVASIPQIPGLAPARPWTNREVTTAHEIPGRLIILGGGAVGAEMAQAYASLGSAVTVLARGAQLLRREEPFVGELLRKALSDRGVDVRLNIEAESVTRDASGLVHVRLSDESVVTGDEILVATGRTALTDDLGLDSVGLTPGGSIEVDDRLQVPGHPWLYAIGDVNGRSLLTHMGKHQAYVVSEILAGRTDPGPGDDAAVSRVVFTEPQVAAVGMTLQAALDLGLDAHAYDVPTSGTAGASFHGPGTPGTSRLVVDEERGLIVGATFTGTDVAEWLHAAAIAIAGRVAIETLWSAVPAFPTRSEVWLKLLEQRESERRTAAGTDARPARNGRPVAKAQRATFAAGCFWGVEAAFRELEGVLETTVGYTGGHAPRPTYEDVCSHRTGHAEAVEVWFDPEQITYGDLLHTFWHIHDATTLHRQGWDIGDQYRSAIFFHNSIQDGLAHATRNDAQESLVKPIVTEIVAATEFYPAEDYHQHYLEKHGPARCAATVR